MDLLFFVVLCCTRQSDVVLAEDGNNVQGWYQEADSLYYFENGNMVLGEKSIDGYWYYFDPEKEGMMAVGWTNTS